ncbi:MAG TPA: MFS transporter [Limnochordia bacterium]|nr:MFS transporter [Limnochordia bacterium]
MSAFYLLFFAAQGVFFPYLTLYYRSIGWDGRMIGALGMFSPLVVIASRPLWGYLADQYQAKRTVLAGGLLLTAASAWLYPISDAFWWLAGATIFAAVAQSSTTPIADSLTLDVLEGRQGHYGRIRLWGSAGFAVTASLAGAFYQAHGLRLMFGLYSGLILITWIGTAALPKGAARPAQRLTWRGGLALLRKPAFALFLLGALLQAAVSSGGWTFMTVYLDALGASKPVVGLAWTIPAVIEIPIFFVTNALVNRIGVRGLLLGAVALQAARMAGIGLTASPYGILAMQTLIGVGFAFLQTGSVLYVNQVIPAEWRATGQSLLAALGSSLGGMLGSIACGTLFDLYGGRVMFLSAAGVALAAGVIFYFALQELRPAGRPPRTAAG